MGAGNLGFSEWNVIGHSWVMHNYDGMQVRLGGVISRHETLDNPHVLITRDLLFINTLSSS